MSLGTALRGENFPCEYPFKLVCLPQAAAQIQAIVMANRPAHEQPRVQQRASRNGKYLALTITVTANSAEEIEAVYAALKGTPGIVTSL